MDLLLEKGLIAIIHIDEEYENALHMQEKEKGFRNYFMSSQNNNFNLVTLSLKHPNFENSLIKGSKPAA